MSQTCADYQVNDINGNDTGMTLLCQGIAGFNPSLGDSGAPVVRMEVLDYVTAVGILNYSTGGFSMMNAIQQEINYAYCPLSSCRP